MYLPSDLHCLPVRDTRARGLALIILALAPILFGFLAIYLGQDANWDLRNYHWYNAYAFLNGRDALDLLPSQTPYFYNPLLDVPFYLVDSHSSAKVAAFFLGTVQGLNFILLFMLAHVALVMPNPRHKVIGCAAIAMLGMLGGGGISMIGTTFYDNVTSLGSLLSALLVIRHSPRLLNDIEKKAFALCFLFGLPSGIMMGLKLTSVIFCVGFCGALFLAQGTWRRRFLLALGFGLGVLAGVAISLGPWALYLQTNYLSPLFPYFNELFQSPLAPLTSARDIQYVANNFIDALFFPFIFADNPHRVGEIMWRDWRLPILYALMPLAVITHVIFGRSRTNPNAAAASYAVRYMFIGMALSYALWLKMFCIYRYAVPMEMITPLLIVMSVGLLPLKPELRAMVSIFVLLVIAGSVQAGDWHRRKTWLDHVVEAYIPPLGDTSDMMILMAGFEPYSHLVTAFPAEIKFVRIQSNFASPNENKGINDRLHGRVESHKGRKMILIPPWQHGLADEALGYYHFRADWTGCQKVVDHLYDDAMIDLCPLHPMSKP
jgi:hypothetical protein